MTSYTREQILSMSAGPELDAIAAVLVFGARPDPHRKGWVKYVDLSTRPLQYAADISAAWRLVVKLQKEYDLKLVLEMKLHNGSYIYFKNDMGGNVTGILDFDSEVPETITKAAILAMMQSGGLGDE